MWAEGQSLGSKVKGEGLVQKGQSRYYSERGIALDTIHLRMACRIKEQHEPVRCWAFIREKQGQGSQGHTTQGQSSQGHTTQGQSSQGHTTQGQRYISHVMSTATKTNLLGNITPKSQMVF